MTITVDGKPVPKPQPLPQLSLRPIPIEGLTVTESNDTGWQDWDSAMAKLDGIYGSHE